MLTLLVVEGESTLVVLLEGEIHGADSEIVAGNGGLERRLVSLH